MSEIKYRTIEDFLRDFLDFIREEVDVGKTRINKAIEVENAFHTDFQIDDIINEDGRFTLSQILQESDENNLWLNMDVQENNDIENNSYLDATEYFSKIAIVYRGDTVKNDVFRMIRYNQVLKDCYSQYVDARQSSVRGLQDILYRDTEVCEKVLIKNNQNKALQTFIIISIIIQ